MTASRQAQNMVVLFVHGMGRTPISGLAMLHLLRRAGMQTSSFCYSTAFDDFRSIQERLVARITSLAASENYIVVGHSLGGVLLRAALNSLPANTNRPRHIFLLGSPIHPSRLAQRLKHNILFRALAGDCGQLLSSSERMDQVGALNEPTTSIVGVRGVVITKMFFGDAPNDGVVSVAEASATWISDQRQVSTVHMLLPSSRRVAEIICKTVFENSDK
ncbi:esterase/lipase family protein [Solimicrobium silvestre]|uniref:Alpha/beta hydrolase family n=1 Tax=Solimicrobium silvestre TaxID=2099400 RepID=A0A2S9GZ35_9BURK|nr:alpha/beta fold hydrolase [Solimicrobium silvestre]PRC92985.1 Alpha/beta hydrolase family [Solimicrobium silvestre]